MLLKTFEVCRGEKSEILAECVNWSLTSNVSGLSIPSAKSFSWMKAGMSPSSEPFTLMERQRNQRRWAAKPAHQARGWGSCTAYVQTLSATVGGSIYAMDGNWGSVEQPAILSNYFETAENSLSKKIHFPYFALFVFISKAILAINTMYMNLCWDRE